MSADLVTLIELAEIDASQRDLGEQLELYPKMLNDIERKRTDFQRKLEAAVASRDEARAARRRSEVDSKGPYLVDLR